MKTVLLLHQQRGLWIRGLVLLHSEKPAAQQILMPSFRLASLREQESSYSIDCVTYGNDNPLVSAGP